MLCPKSAPTTFPESSLLWKFLPQNKTTQKKKEFLNKNHNHYYHCNIIKSSLKNCFFDVKDYYINISVLLPINTKKKEYTLKNDFFSISISPEFYCEMCKLKTWTQKPIVLFDLFFCKLTSYRLFAFLPNPWKWLENTQCGGLLYTQSLLKNKLNLNRKKLTVRMENGKKTNQ